MTTLLRRHINLKSLCRWKLGVKYFHNDCNFSQVVFPYMNSVLKHTNEFKRFTTTVHRFQTSADSANKEKPAFLASEDASLKAVENALIEMDYAVQRTGRTVRVTVENILQLVEDAGFASNIHGLYLLRSCGLMRSESPSQRIDLVDTIWSKLKNLGCQFDVGHFNSLLRVYVENKHNFSPSEFLMLMDNHKIEANKVTYLLLLEKYATEGNLSGASEVLQYLKDKGLPINEAVFNTLIKCHMKANDFSGARDILEVMRSSNLPSAATYTVLACGYAEQGQIKEIESVFQEAKDNNVILSNINYLSIVSSLPAEHSEFVDSILERMSNINDWRQDVLNCVLDLIHRDLDHIAYKLVLAVASVENNSTNVFIKQLIKSGKPIEKVIAYCKEIQSLGLNDYIFINSAKAASDYNMFDHAVSLFEELQKLGIPVRNNYFWPFFSFYKNSEEGIWNTLKKMYQLGVPPDFMIYNNYILPAISLTNPQAVIAKVQEIGLSPTFVIDALFQYYCHQGEINNALFMMENYPVRVRASFNLEKFLCWYDRSTSNPHVYAEILNFVLRINDMLPGREKEELQGKQLALLIKMNPSLFQVLQKKPYNKNLKYSQLTLHTCWNILKEQCPHRLVHLQTLESSQPPRSMPKTVEEEDKELNFLKKKGVSREIEHYILELLHHHVKEKNIARVDELKAELDNLGVIYPPVLYAQLLHLYSEINNLEAATKMLDLLKEKYPSFKVESIKIMDYATQLIKFSKFEEAKKIIENECKELHIFGSNEAVFRSIRKLFNAAIETGNCDLVKSIQSCLIHHSKAFSFGTAFSEPLLKMHIYRNDIDSAVNEFRNCVLNHKVMPCLNQLMRKCIVADDHQNLETVIGLSSGLIGENKMCHEVAVAFLETGRKMQALKMMQTLGSKADPAYIANICSRLYNQNRVIELEDFLHVIRGLEHIDQENFFYFLFKLYDRNNDFEKGLEFYKLIEKEKLFNPSDRIKMVLEKLLTRNGQPIPFSAVNHAHEPVNSYKTETSEFLESLNKEDVFQSIQKLQNMKKGLIHSLPSSEMSKFVDLLLRNKCAIDISHNVQAMSYIIQHSNEVLKPLLEKYSVTGDVESLKGMASFLPDFTLKKAFFNTYYAKTHFSCGKHEDLLLELEKFENLASAKNKLFSIAAFEGLLKVSNLEERVINLAKRYLVSNFDLPIAVVWAHFLTNEKYEEAKQLFTLHSVPADKVDTMVLKVVRQDGNIKMGEVYIEAINELNVRNRCKERAYGTLLDVFVLKNMHDDAIALLADAKERNIHLEKYYRSTLITLKGGLEKENKEVPFTIPSEEFIISS